MSRSCESVEATNESSVLLFSEATLTHYRTPKGNVEGFDGHAVSLKLPKIELERYKSSHKEGLGKIK